MHTYLYPSHLPTLPGLHLFQMILHVYHHNNKVNGNCYHSLFSFLVAAPAAKIKSNNTNNNNDNDSLHIIYEGTKE